MTPWLLQITWPFFIRHSHFLIPPFPFPILTSCGFFVNGRWGNIVIHVLACRRSFFRKVFRTDSSWLIVILPDSWEKSLIEHFESYFPKEDLPWRLRRMNIFLIFFNLGAIFIINFWFLVWEDLNLQHSIYQIDTLTKLSYKPRKYLYFFLKHFAESKA